MATNILLVGLATDGPSDVVLNPKNEREMNTLYGGIYYDRSTATPTSTSITTLFEPLSLPLNEVDSVKQWLYAPYRDTTNRSLITFGALGGSANQTVDLIYSPYLGKEDVLVAAKRYYDINSSFPYIARIGGTTASGSIQGWEFESVYPGAKYNNVTLVSNGSSLTVTGMLPEFISKSYTFTSVAELYNAIERDYQLGICPFMCTKAGTAMITAGTYSLSGGTNGSFSNADIINFLENVTIPPIVTHVVFLTELTSGIVDAIADHLSTEGIQPRVFFVNSPTYATSAGASSWLTSIATALPYGHDYLTSFVGTITTPFRGESLTRYAVEGAAIAFGGSNGFNLTNLPVVAESFYPVFDEDDLVLIKNGGFVPLMRYIQNDISIYEGTPTVSGNSFLFTSKVAEISALATDYCWQFFGQLLPEGELADIASELRRQLVTKVAYVEIKEVTVIKAKEEMFVRIEGLLFDEILDIKFTVQSR